MVPPRPLKLDRRFVRKTIGAMVFFGLFGLLVGPGLVVWQAMTARDILAQGQVWREGVEASDVRVEGKRKTRLFFNEYDLTVHYTDDTGAFHVAELEFGLLGADADGEATAVKYDRADPTQIAISWAEHHSGARWAECAVFLAIGLGLGGLVLYVFLLGVRRLSEARAAARASDEVRVEIVSSEPMIVKGKHHGTRFTLRYRKPTDGTEVTFKENLPQGMEPLRDGDKVVALLADGARHPVVVAEGGYPFDWARTGPS